jgi:protein-S-isoprenylcysteine O-methyltransferase Ste14
MTTDDLFRWILLLIFAAFLPMAMYYRFRSHTGEKLDRWQEGVFILFGLRLSGVPALVGFVAWMIDPEWMEWSSVPLPVWLRWAGIALNAVWGMLLVWTFHTLGPNLTDTVVTRKNHTLVTTGPYRFVRHPFYLAFAVAVVGGSLVTANWFLFLAGLLPFGFLLARTPIEEENLVERFGAPYRDYMRTTGRFLPRLTRKTKPGS